MDKKKISILLIITVLCTVFIPITVMAAAPSVSTSNASNFTAASATLNGSIDLNGGYAITDCGFYWGTSSTSLTNKVSVMSSYSGTYKGPITYNLSGLNAATTYYYCTYAVNSGGEGKGTVTSFGTLATVPSVSTSSAANITSNSTTLNGSINKNCGSAITDCGFYWGTSSTSLTNKVSVMSSYYGTYIGSISSNLSSLNAATTYYYCTYAVNGIGESKGTVLSFGTLSSVPVVSTSTATSVTTTSATLNGSINKNCGSAITDCGFYWGTSSTSLTNKVSVMASYSGTYIGNITYNLSGLSAATTYYYSTYAVNGNGESKGTVVSFGTLATAPYVSTSAAANIATNSATLNGSINKNGGSAITDCGFYWGTSSTSLTNKASLKTSYSGTYIGNITYNLSSLNAATTYYYCTYAVNGIGESKGTVLSFGTLTSVPEVSTSTATSVTKSSAILNGSINKNCGSAITDCGFYWGTSSTSLTNKVSVMTSYSGTYIGNITYNLSGINAATTYYYSTYAVNGNGESKGTVVSFGTLATAPSVSTSAAANIATNSATLNGSINKNGGSAITDCGFYWGTSSTSLTNKVSLKTSYSGTYIGSITYDLGSLNAATTYYFCTYAVNGIGESKGTVLSFGTLSGIPSVSTSVATSVTKSSAVLNGLIDLNAGSAITDCGFYWGTSSTSLTNKVSVISSYSSTYKGPIIYNLTGLNVATTYYYCTYAVNGIGEGKGTILSFGTLSDIPTVSTTAATNIVTTSATFNGSINLNGGSAITDCGFYWGTSSTSLTNKTSIMSSYSNTYKGPISYDVSGLQPATKYYFCSYAVNGIGEGKGTVLSLGTASGAPVVRTGLATDVTQTAVVINGFIDLNCGSPVTDCGFYWGTSPTALMNKVSVMSSYSGTYKGNIKYILSTLQAANPYYFCVYAVNANGESKGAVEDFGTLAAKPTVSTTNVTDVTATSVTFNGSIDFNGGAVITDCGFYWGTSATNLTNKVSVMSDYAGTYKGPILYGLDGLQAATSYYFCAYGVNENGESKGNVINYGTLSSIPTTSTGSETNVTFSSATLNGSVDKNGGESITDCGFYWGTSENDMPNKVSVMTNYAGTYKGPISYNLYNLQAANTYFYCTYAVNANGEVVGDIQSLGTLSTKPTVSTNLPSDIDNSSTTLSGTILKNGGEVITDCGFYWGTSPSNLTSKVSVMTNYTGTYKGEILYGLFGLQTGSSYYYQTYALNKNGESRGTVVNFSTIAIPMNHKICGYVLPDFSFEDSVAGIVKSGFKVDVVELSLSSVTDANGYFEVNDIPNGVYTLKISKNCYLTRTINNIVASGSNVRVGTTSAPISMWAGDVVQDNALNMTDILRISTVFNSVAGDGQYVVDYDFNRDGAINMSDTMIVSKHFNSIPSNYPACTIDSPSMALNSTEAITIRKGQSISLKGLITSNSNITKVTIGVKDLMNCYDTTIPNSCSFDLSSFKIDTTQGKTPSGFSNPFTNMGTYTLTVWAKADGMDAIRLGYIDVTVTEPPVKMIGAESINVLRGQNVNLKGLVTSESNISKVTIGVANFMDCYDSVYPGSTAFDLDSFVIDTQSASTPSGLKNPFSSQGTYTLTVWALSEGYNALKLGEINVTVKEPVKLSGTVPLTVTKGQMLQMKGLITSEVNIAKITIGVAGLLNCYDSSYPNGTSFDMSSFTIDTTQAKDPARGFNNPFYNPGSYNVTIWAKIDGFEAKKLGEIPVTVMDDVSTNFSSLTRTLSKGCKGADVAQLQRVLIWLGYLDDRTDGAFGGNTVDAVNAIKLSMGLPQDGVVNQNTWNKIMSKWDSEKGSLISNYASSVPFDIYKPYIAALKKVHPNWNFTFYNTGIKWKDFVAAEFGTNNLTQKPEWISDYTYNQDSWFKAKGQVVEHFADPRNFLNEMNVFQFQLLSYDPDQYNKDVVASGVAAILSGTFMGNDTYKLNFLDAASASKANPYFLSSKSRLEMGPNGNPLSEGTVSGYAGFYNYYNIGAYPHGGKGSIQNGAIEAQKRSWNSRRTAIIGGANYISDGFIGIGQDTMYTEKFDLIDTLYTHQYVQNVAAACDESCSYYTGYKTANFLNNAFEFKIPYFEGMPSVPAALPGDINTGSVNATNSSGSTNTGTGNGDIFTPGKISVTDDQIIQMLHKYDFSSFITKKMLNSYIRSIPFPDPDGPQYPAQIVFDSQNVLTAQRQLYALGFNIGTFSKTENGHVAGDPMIDGQYGVLTASGIILFQYAAGVSSITGKLDSETMNKLNEYYNLTSTDSKIVQMKNKLLLSNFIFNIPTFKQNGYHNGYLNTSNFVVIPGDGCVGFLPKETALAWAFMVRDAAKDQKNNIGKFKLMGPNSGYRTYEWQYCKFIENYIKYNYNEKEAAKWAAHPGGSGHGWGTAIDFAIGGVGTQEHTWLKNNAYKYKLVPYVNESWHWYYMNQ